MLARTTLHAQIHLHLTVFLARVQIQNFAQLGTSARSQVIVILTQAFVLRAHQTKTAVAYTTWLII